VRLRGQVTLYEPRGSYQIVARLALPAGDGMLAAELAKLRARLAKEGLFDPSRKRPLPAYPRVVGVVTSVSGAAVHDIVEVARGRCPVRIAVAHCQVQGSEAPASIVRALALVQRVPELDVVIVGRGGGGAEDLAAFDDERVARAIAACRVPVVSAVGHEVDVSIADLVADVRAATPSNAAELVVPDRAATEGRLQVLARRMERALDARLDRERLRLDRLVRRLGDPRRTFGRARAALLDLERKLRAAMRRRLSRERARVGTLGGRLARQDPRARLVESRRRLADLERRLGAVRVGMIERRRARLGALVARVDALSPLAVLGRGYAIALHGPTGRALTRAADARPGDLLRLRLHEGCLDATVVRTSEAGREPAASAVSASRERAADARPEGGSGST
jgi:exodeoxyribonuclease VII large subunit